MHPGSADAGKRYSPAIGETTAKPHKHRAEGSPYAGHIRALDGVRALAVAGVLMSHLFPGTPSSPLQHRIYSFMANGVYGVDLFFALSGFLITGILFDSLHDERFFRKFYARRALRIFPLYYGVLLLCLFTVIFLGKNYHGELLSIALYLHNTPWIAPQIWLYRGPSELPLAHFWSLAVEEQFYLVWPLLVFLLRQRRRILIGTVLFSLLSIGLRALAFSHLWTTQSINANTLLRMDSLLAGGALAMLLRGSWHDRILRYAPWAFLLAFAANLFVVEIAWRILPFADPLWGSLHYTGMTLISTALLALALRRGTPLERVFSLRPMTWIGKYSYGIYVIHIPIFELLRGPLRELLLGHLTHSKLVSGVLTGVLCAGLTVVAAWASYNLYEKRFLRLKRFFEYRRHPNTPTAAEVGAVS